MQSRRDGAAAKRFFKRLLRGQGEEPRQIVTDKLRSYGVAQRALLPETLHNTAQYANNRAELSHQPTRDFFPSFASTTSSLTISSINFASSAVISPLATC